MTQYEDVIQSTRRKYNFQIKELELKASRGDIESQKKLENLQAQSAFKLETIGRSAEKILGTKNLGGITDYTPGVDVLGDIEQQRREAILKAAQLGLPQ